MTITFGGLPDEIIEAVAAHLGQRDRQSHGRPDILRGRPMADTSASNNHVCSLCLPNRE